MKKSIENKRNNIGNATLTAEARKLNTAFDDLITIKKAIVAKKEELRSATSELIDVNYQRILDKFTAKVPYLIRKDGKHRNGQNRHVELIGCNKIFAITERGVIFRVQYQVTGKYRTFSGALELSHEQMAMSEADWKAYVDGYRAFIAAEYPIQFRKIDNLEELADAVVDHLINGQSC